MGGRLSRPSLPRKNPTQDKVPAAATAQMLSSIAAALESDWNAIARPAQLPPPGSWWTIWLILSGRAFGKTRAGSEWVREQVKTNQYVNLIGATADDAR